MYNIRYATFDDAKILWEINIGKELKEYRYVKEIEQLKEVTFRQWA